MQTKNEEFRPFTKVKTFSVTSFRDRVVLGDDITDWLRDNNVEPIDTVVMQSSDHAFHCFSLIVFY